MTVWTDGKQISYRYCEVDPRTWRDLRPLGAVTDCSVTRDRGSDFLGGVQMTVGEYVANEMYVREYLLATQRGVTEQVCLGTHLVQVSKLRYTGKSVLRPLSGFSPAKELDAAELPTFHQVRSGSDPVVAAAALMRAKCRAPVVGAAGSGVSLASPMTAERDDTPLSFVRKLLDAASMELCVDPYGRFSIEPVRDSASLQPVWEFRDDEVSILFPEADEETKWGSLPNVLRATFDVGGETLVGRAVNTDPSSALSTAVRGREVYESGDGSVLPAGSTQADADAAAMAMLRERSCDTRTIMFSHGYCPVFPGNGVLFDYTAHSRRARLRVERQVIELGSSSCTVTTTGSHTESLWR